MKCGNKSVKLVLILLLMICIQSCATLGDFMPACMVSAATSLVHAAKSHSPAWMTRISTPRLVVVSTAVLGMTAAIAGYFGRKRLGSFGTNIWSCLFRRHATQVRQTGVTAPLESEPSLVPNDIKEIIAGDKITGDYVAGPIISMRKGSFLIGTAGEKSVVGFGNQVDVYSPLTGKRLKSILIGYQVQPNLAAISENYLITVTPQNRVQVRTLSDGRIVKEYPPKEKQQPISYVAVAGESVAAAFPNGVRLWNMSTGAEKEVSAPTNNLMRLSKDKMYITEPEDSGWFGLPPCAYNSGFLYDTNLKSGERCPSAVQVSAMSDTLFVNRMNRERVHIWSPLGFGGKTIPIRYCSALALSEYHLAAVHGSCKNNISINNCGSELAKIELLQRGHSVRSIAMTPAKNIAAYCLAKGNAVIRFWQAREWRDKHEKALAFLEGQHQRCGGTSPIAKLAPDTAQHIAELALMNDETSAHAQ